MKLIFFIRTTSDHKIKRDDFRDISNRLRSHGNEIDIYDTATGVLFRLEEQAELKVLKEYHISRHNRLLLLLTRLFSLYRLCSDNRNDYDVAHFCYVREEFLILWWKLRRVADKTIITIYGADLGSRNLIKKIFSKFLYNADILTVTGSNGRDLLKKYYDYDRLKEKIMQIPLPSLVLKEVASSVCTRAEAKARLGLSPDDYVVVCGSVLSRNEQYERWLKKLEITTFNDRALIFFFPFTYGDESYRVECTRTIYETLPHKNVRIISGWMSNEATAELRIATDVLITLRRSDQFAGIIIESLAAGSMVITGDWLGYKYLDENLIWHYRITRFDQLRETLEKALYEADKSEIRSRADQAREILLSSFGYEKVAGMWDNFYRELPLLKMNIHEQ